MRRERKRTLIPFPFSGLGRRFSNISFRQKYHTARLGVTPSRAEADTQRMAFVYPAVALHLARNDTHCIGVARHFTAEFGIHLISRHLFSGFPTRAADRFCRPYESGSSVNGFHDQFFSVPDILSLWEDVGTQKEKRLPLSRHTHIERVVLGACVRGGGGV